MGIRYNEKRERFKDVVFGEDYDDFTSRFVEHSNRTNLTLIEYYLPKKREHLYIVSTPRYNWANTQNYNLAEYIFNHLNRWLCDYSEDKLYNSSLSKNIIYHNC